MYHNLRYRKGSEESRTVSELKTLSWSLYQRKEGGTNDKIVIHLIKSFDKCRNNHHNNN